MCSSAPKVKPVASAPYVGPEVIDDMALQERDRAKQRNRQRAGRMGTILAGNTGGTPAMQAKTALGS